MKKLITALVVMVAMTVSACCKPGVQSGWCNAQQAVAQCSTKLLEGKLPGLLQQVEKVLVGGAPDFKAQLDGLNVDGISVAYCVVRKYVELNTTPVVPTKSTPGVATKVSALTVKDPAKTVALLRALDYLGTRSVK